MASEAQISANRINAQRSTGPKTREGKRRSRRNAIKHGLTAELTVAEFECAASYRAFESRIYADYAPKCVVENLLVSRLASLLWRLRRVPMIESGLMDKPGERARDTKGEAAAISDVGPVEAPGEGGRLMTELFGAATAGHPVKSKMAESFLRIISADNKAFDRLERYEVSLWRQAAQTLYVLKTIQETTIDLNRRYSGTNGLKGAFGYRRFDDHFKGRW